MNDAGALQDLLHDAGGLIPSAARRRGRDDPEVLVDGLCRSGRRNSADDQRDTPDRANESKMKAQGSDHGATQAKFAVSSMLPVPL